MDTDNPNLNNAAHDHREWWESFKKEHEAKMDKMEASKRMEANDAFKNFSEEVDAASDWVEADWEQFKARVSKWSNELEINADEAI